jgi:hypothetical protein
MIRIIEGKTERKKSSVCAMCSQYHEKDDTACNFCSARNYFAIICPNCGMKNIYYTNTISHQQKSCLECQRHLPSIAALLMKDPSFREAYHYKQDL